MASSIQNARPLLDKLAGLSGRVIAPTDSAYDQARTVFYGGIDKRPAAIARVSNVSDVRRVVAAAPADGYELAVRSGGHSVVGHGTTDGGVVIDMRDMSKIEIDVQSRTA